MNIGNESFRLRLWCFLKLKSSNLHLFLVFQGRKKVLCNNVRVSKWWPNFNLWVNYPFNVTNLILISIKAGYKHKMGCISCKTRVCVCGSEVKFNHILIRIRKNFKTHLYTCIVKMEPIVSNASWESNLNGVYSKV